MTVAADLRRRMGEWFQGSVNRRILAAALTVGAFSLVVKITAMVKELAIAYRFGTGDAVDAFLIAFLIPQLVINVVAGSLTPAFTPVYIEVRESEGALAARRLFGSATAASAAMLIVLMCGLLVVMPFGLRLLGSGFSAEKLALTRSLFFILLPVVLLNAVVTIWSAVLNAEERFASVALAPISVPLLTLIMVVVAGRTWGIYALTLGTVFGFFGQCGVLAVAVARQALPVLPRWSGFTPALRRVASQYLPMVAGAALTTGSWTIGQAMAATLPAGSVASLNYGNKVVAMISEIGSMALATAVLPHFSAMVARREWSAIRRTVRVYSRLIAAIAVPATLALILFSSLIVRLVFERGAFTTVDTKHVATIQALYFVQMPFVMVGMLFVRLASSLQRNQILLLGAMITLPLNVVLNLVLMRWLGVAGIALSTSLIYLVSCCYLMLSVHRGLRIAEHRASAGVWVREQKLSTDLKQ
jgi:putative peptidoglycan lipid II flippase